MSVENAVKFLEEAAKDEKLAALLERVSPEELKQAVEEIRLEDVAGGNILNTLFPESNKGRTGRF